VTSPSTTEFDSNSGFLGRMVRASLSVLAAAAVALCWLGLLMVGALIGFWSSEGTSYHQLAIGAVMSSVSLFVLMALFECVWWAVSCWYRRLFAFR
jgi:hypothetical protein